MSKVYLDDARNLKNKIKPASLDVTITSPPYFDMKDYGHSEQIGFGQTYEEYLKELQSIFKEVYSATKNSGSLWVVIDTFKRDGVVVPLPFDFAREISLVGWKLQDIIVWKKDKTVPWSKKGATRKIFEYVLFFSKGSDFKYYSERAREITELKEWWIRYPERYSPNGKSLEEIWEFSIPTQGSWGDGYIRHFCPLPEDLVRRIITLTTNEKDVVFDPFSGSGTVPAQAAFMNRKYFGFELNPEYVEMFESYLKKNLMTRRASHAALQTSLNEDAFKEKIINLRILKYGRVLAKKMKLTGFHVEKVWAERTTIQPIGKYEIASASYSLLINSGNCAQDALQAIEKIIKEPPLSKFGIAPQFGVSNSLGFFESQLPATELFSYSASNTHKYIQDTPHALKSQKSLVISSIAVNINETDYRDME
jgi:DNA modification methylase